QENPGILPRIIPGAGAMPLWRLQSRDVPPRGDISTLAERGHFYFGLTVNVQFQPNRGRSLFFF
ncbi:MAG TPA: hypothetical protein VMT91_13490, partial [Anaerolineales bacterium]|nr:hypothetical protein [Anaerolineales bacterium]